MERQIGTVPPTVRWPAKGRLSAEERSALDVYTREVEVALRSLSNRAVSATATVVASQAPTQTVIRQTTSSSAPDTTEAVWFFGGGSAI